MLMSEAHYEIFTEDENGFNPLSESFDTRAEAEAWLNQNGGKFPGSFVALVTYARCEH